MLGIITVRLAKVSDAKSLFDWRNDPNIRAVSEQTKPLIWEDHIRWLTHTLQSNTEHVFIGEQDGVPIGVVRFSVEHDHALVSLALAPEAQGKGYGKSLLALGMIKGDIMNKKTVIFDLDGTLANIDVRRDKSLKPNGKLDWEIFAAPKSILDWDTPNEPVIKMAQMFNDYGYKVVIFSGRNDRGFVATKHWLTEHDVPYDLLVMRPDKFKANSWPIADGNPATPDMRYMPDEILKKKMLDTFVDKDDVFMTVDDRQKVVDMWRDLGLNTFQVAPGDF